MNRFSVRIASILSALAILLTLGASTASAAGNGSAVAQAAQSGRALTFQELYRLYRDHSWIWDDGAGHFRVSKREFTAWTGAGSQGSYADGMWFFPDVGRLCFRAQWNAVAGSSRALTCFEHRTANGRIYQRRLPNGEWYVFANSPRQPGDEIRKLRRGDHVRPNYEANRRFIEAQRPRRSSRR
jgi:hypothetical protein